MGAKTEYDVNNTVWECYKIMYSENFKDDFLIVESSKRKYIFEQFQYNGKILDKIRFSGETDFNFKDGFSYSIYPRYKKFLSDETLDFKLRESYLKQLNICRDLMYSIVNVSLMPQTGAMQLIKGGLGNDRLDRFVWALNGYYNGEFNLLMSRASYQNISSLKKFLGLFSNVYEYCEVIYHINKQLVDDLIKLGSCELDCHENIVLYMNLAYEFWKQKLSCLKNEAITSDICNDLKNIQSKLDDFKAINKTLQ